jgi:excisionase family DNA binding protein
VSRARSDRSRGPSPNPKRPNLAVELPDEVLESIAERAAELVAERLAAEAAPSPWLDVAGAAEYIGGAPTSRVYALVSAGRIPHHRDGSRLLFHRDELDAWIRDGGGKRP